MLACLTAFHLICNSFPSHIRYISISYSIRFYLIFDTFLSHIRYVSISYSIHFYLICDTFLSHIRYVSISYSIHFYLIFDTFPSHMRYLSIAYSGETHTACFKIPYTFQGWVYNVTRKINSSNLRYFITLTVKKQGQSLVVLIKVAIFATAYDK